MNQPKREEKSDYSFERSFFSFRCRRVKNFLAVNKKYNPGLQNNTRVKSPRNPSKCWYLISSWMIVWFAETASNLCECSQVRIGPEIWISVNPESFTSLCWACQRIGNGPTHNVKFEWDPSTNGSICWMVRKMGGGVKSFKARGSEWKFLTCSSLLLTENEYWNREIRLFQNMG